MEDRIGVMDLLSLPPLVWSHVLRHLEEDTGAAGTVQECLKLRWPPEAFGLLEERAKRRLSAVPTVIDHRHGCYVAEYSHGRRQVLLFLADGPAGGQVLDILVPKGHSLTHAVRGALLSRSASSDGLRGLGTYDVRGSLLRMNVSFSSAVSLEVSLVLDVGGRLLVPMCQRTLSALMDTDTKTATSWGRAFEMRLFPLSEE